MATNIKAMVSDSLRLKISMMKESLPLLARTLTTQGLVTETGKDVLRVINN
jgi:hypothetical protein